MQMKKYCNYVCQTGWKKLQVAVLILNSKSVQIVDEYRYLGGICTDNTSDDADILRHIIMHYGAGNKIIGIINECTDDVKTYLFKTLFLITYIIVICGAYQ